MFSSMASAPASCIFFAYFIQPPAETPFRLAMMGMETFFLALAMYSRYSSGPILNSEGLGK